MTKPLGFKDSFLNTGGYCSPEQGKKQIEAVMAIKAEGQALLSSTADGTLHEIDAADLEWEVIGSDEKSMGPDVLHRASIDHPELGEISWTISEYPPEVLNHVTPEMNGNLLLEDLIFWYEHKPEDDYYEAIRRIPVEFSIKQLEEAPAERQQEMLVAWFRSRYEDPAQETPYDGREGGYQYIWVVPMKRAVSWVTTSQVWCPRK